FAQGNLKEGNLKQGKTREQSFAHMRGAQEVQRQGRFAHEGRFANTNGAGKSLSRAPQPTARGHEATRFSAAPAGRPAMQPHIAQPNAGRANVGHVGGPPMNARAQMGGGPHAAPATPHAGGGAPAVNAAPRAGGGGPAAGPPGRKRHWTKRSPAKRRAFSLGGC